MVILFLLISTMIDSDVATGGRVTNVAREASSTSPGDGLDLVDLSEKLHKVKIWAKETKNFYEIDQIFPTKVAKFNRLGTNF